MRGPLARWFIATRCRLPARCRSICMAWASTISACPRTSSAARRESARWSCAQRRAVVRRIASGADRESYRRAGTENVAGIAGVGAAAEASRNGLDVATLRDAIEACLPGKVHGAGAPRLPNTTCLSMPSVTAETQVMALDLAGVAVSAGSGLARRAR